MSNVKDVANGRSNPTVFFSSRIEPYVEKYRLADEMNIRYFFESARLMLGEKDRVDMTKVMPKMFSVVHVAILSAMYMGFSEIILLGCDCTGFVTLANEFSGKKADQEQYCYTTDAADMEISQEAMRSSRIVDELQSYVDMLKNYEVLSKMAQKNGVSIMNATDGGVLDVFPRVPLFRLFELA